MYKIETSENPTTDEHGKPQLSVTLTDERTEYSVTREIPLELVKDITEDNIAHSILKSVTSIIYIMMLDANIHSLGKSMDQAKSYKTTLLMIGLIVVITVSMRMPELAGINVLTFLTQFVSTFLIGMITARYVLNRNVIE